MRPARATSPMPSASVLPSSRDSSRPSSSVRARIVCRPCPARRCGLRGWRPPRPVRGFRRGDARVHHLVLSEAARDDVARVGRIQALERGLRRGPIRHRRSETAVGSARCILRDLFWTSKPRGADSHQLRHAERPGRRLVAGRNLVLERAEPFRGNAHDVADLVGEAEALRAAVHDRREHRAEEQREAVRILVVPADRLGDELGRVAADLGHRALALELEAVLAHDLQPHQRAAHVVEPEARRGTGG